MESLALEHLENNPAEGYRRPLQALTEHETRSWQERLEAYEKVTGTPLRGTLPK